MENSLEYAGIGNRDIPEEVYVYLYRVGQYLGRIGYHGFSGGADGCDDAFERGAKDENHPFTVYKANTATPEAIEFAKNYHPAWNACSSFVRKLHGRNAMILMGENLQKPRNFVICAAVDENRGGTALGLRIARDNGIPVYNYYKNPEELNYFLQSLGD